MSDLELRKLLTIATVFAVMMVALLFAIPIWLTNLSNMLGSGIGI